MAEDSRAVAGAFGYERVKKETTGRERGRAAAALPDQIEISEVSGVLGEADGELYFSRFKKDPAGGERLMSVSGTRKRLVPWWEEDTHQKDKGVDDDLEMGLPRVEVRTEVPLLGDAGKGLWSSTVGKIMAYGLGLQQPGQKSKKLDSCRGLHNDMEAAKRQKIREGVDSAIKYQLNFYQSAYYAIMTLGFTALFSRHMLVGEQASSREEAYMAVEMIGIFFTLTSAHYNVLSFLNIDNAPRVTRWYQCGGTLTMWSMTTSYMLIYTTRIPDVVFGWWLWLITAFYISFVLLMTIKVGCLGHVKVEEAIHLE